MKIDPEPEKLYVDACAVGFLNKRVPYIRFYTPHKYYEFELFLVLDVTSLNQEEYTTMDIVNIALSLLASPEAVDKKREVKKFIQEYIAEFKPALVIDGLEEVQYSEYGQLLPAFY